MVIANEPDLTNPMWAMLAWRKTSANSSPDSKQQSMAQFGAIGPNLWFHLFRRFFSFSPVHVGASGPLRKSLELKCLDLN